MERWSDPAHFRVGVNLPAVDDAPISTSKLMTTLNEVMARGLNLMRLGLIAAPVLVQCFFMHSVGIVSWLFRLLVVYLIMGFVCFVSVPEQLYNGMGLGMFRWAFEIFYPEIARANGSLQAPAERSVPRVAGCRIDKLAGQRAKLRWHGSTRFLCLTPDGWAVTGDEKHACAFELQNVYWRDKQVPDTYRLRVMDDSSDFSQCWLSFKPVNHLRFGGWLAAYEDESKASPYKATVLNSFATSRALQAQYET